MLEPHYYPDELISTCRHIAQGAAHVFVRQLCHMLHVAPAAYYAWQRAGQRPVAKLG